MSVVRIDNFGGLVLTKDAKKGPFWTALKAMNCDVQSGSIDVAYGLSVADAVNLTGAVGKKTLNNISGTTFLEFLGDVDVVRSVLADNSSNRVYYTGEEIAKVTDYGLAIGGPAPYPYVSYTLGLPIPAAIVTATRTVLGVDAETRAYISTIVSPWGEESAPSAPKIVNAEATGSTVELENIGLVTRGYSGAGPAPYGIPVTAIAWVAGPPGLIRLTLGPIGVFTFPTDIRPGDRVYWQSDSGTTDNRYTGYLVGAVNAGAGTVDLAANIWDNFGPPSTGKLWRIPPINNYNVVGVTNLGGGRVRVYVDTVDGLRVGEKVVITEVVGMTDLNATFAADKVNATKVQNPYFEVLLATAQAYVSGGRCDRLAKHNTGEIRVLGAAFAAGVCTLSLEHIGGVDVADNIMVAGIFGAYQANGLRVVTAVNQAARSVSFVLAAMGAYTSGGVVIQESPNTFESWPLSIPPVASGGVYPAVNVITLTMAEETTLKVDDLILGYDIGGSVELNNMLRVDSVAATYIFNVAIAGPMTGFTAGGRVAKLRPQFAKRLYRTATGSQDAEYQFLAQINGDEGRYKDTVNTNALGDVIESTDWIQPPVGLKGLIAHPHGFHVGFVGNQLIPSEPGQLHAFPLKNRVPLPFDIVSLGIYDTTIIAFTTNVPIYVTGLEPGKLTRGRSDVGEPCTSKRSTRSTGLGVFARGNSGFFLIGSQGAERVTKNYLPAALFNAASDTPSAYYGGKIIWIDNATRSGYLFDPVRADKGLTEFSVDFDVYGLYVSEIDGQLWASYLDATGAPQAKRAPLFKIVANPAKFTYRTQYIPLTKPTSFGVCKVEWDAHLQSATMKDREKAIVRNLRRRYGDRFGAFNDAAFNGLAFDGDLLEAIYSPDRTLSVPVERYCHLKVTAEPNNTDKTTVVYDDFVTSEDAFRLKDGIKSDSWQVEFEGNAKVTAVTLASTAQELERV